MTRWKILPREQCQGKLGLTTQHRVMPDNAFVLGIRNFIVNFIISSSKDEETLRNQKALINKLNLVLISILKQEWPDNWPTFINEIVSASRTSLSLCENNMVILRLLSEEVFDYSADQMTSQKTRSLKETLNNQFAQIFKLCDEVLRSADSATLLKTTLETLLRFLNWIPLGYIFETDIVDIIRTKYLIPQETRNIAMKCLTEIASLSIPPTFNNYDEKLVQMFTETLTTVSEILPISTPLKSVYRKGNSRDQEFIQNLAMWLCAFFSTHLSVSMNFTVSSVIPLTHPGHRKFTEP